MSYLVRLNQIFGIINRGLLFQKEIALFGKPILGPNPYTDYNPTSSQIEDDVVRSIGSLVYRARKILINKNLTHDQRYTIIKWVIYAASNALAYKGIFRNRKRDIINDFVVNFGAIGDVEKFLKYKLDPSLPIPDDVLFEALEILEKLSHYFFNERHSLG